MALTQMQIIQSLGEAMTWFGRELHWGVAPTELRHLSGRIGELYAALITNGQMATAVNQKGYDVVSGLGHRVSVKTTARMGSRGHISFNPSTLDHVDQVIILKINTEEMQIETLLNTSKEEALNLMGDPGKDGKIKIALSKLLKSAKQRADVHVINDVQFKQYTLRELETGSIEVELDGNVITPAKPILRKIASQLNVEIVNSNGNPYNTRQLGNLLIRTIQNRDEE